MRTSTHSSLNQRLSAAPLAVLRTATGFLLSALSYSARGISRREDFVLRLYLAVTSIFYRAALLKRNRFHLAHSSALQHYLAAFFLAASAFLAAAAAAAAAVGTPHSPVSIVFLLIY